MCAPDPKPSPALGSEHAREGRAVGPSGSWERWGARPSLPQGLPLPPGPQTTPKPTPQRQRRRRGRAEPWSLPPGSASALQEEASTPAFNPLWEPPTASVTLQPGVKSEPSSQPRVPFLLALMAGPGVLLGLLRPPSRPGQAGLELRRTATGRGTRVLLLAPRPCSQPTGTTMGAPAAE